MSTATTKVVIILGAVIAWLAGSFGIAALWDWAVDDHDLSVLMSFFTGMAWGYLIVPIAFLAWDRWVTRR